MGWRRRRSRLMGQLSWRCAACRHAIRLHDRRGVIAVDLETKILHHPGVDDDDDNGDRQRRWGRRGEGAAGDRDRVRFQPRGVAARMAAYAAHTLAELRVGILGLRGC